MAETLQNNGEVTDGDQEHLIPMSPEARERHTQFMAEQAAKLAEERAAYEQRREESLGRVEKSRARLRELFDDPTREWLSRDPNAQAGKHAEAGDPQLPLEIRRFISPQELSDNARRYPEMAYEIEPTILDSVRERLTQLPLVHRTDAPRLAAGEVQDTRGFDTPVPYSWVRQQQGRRPEGNTYALDRQADLDEFVFMSWGGIYADHGSFLGGSRYAVLIEPDLLQDPHCVVTPTDIAQHVDDGVMDRGLELGDRQDARELRDEYFGKMVTGRDWLEIEARRIAKRVADGEISLDDLGKLSADDLGEVKFFGEVPRSAVIASLDTHDSKEYGMYRKYIKGRTGFKLPYHSRFARRHLV